MISAVDSAAAPMRRKNWLPNWARRSSMPNSVLIAPKNNAAYLASWIELLKSDSRAIFTAASKASKAAEYLRGLALAEPMKLAA